MMGKNMLQKVKNTNKSKRQRDPLAILYTLALWRLRQTWRHLLLIGLALLAACTIACVPPLFSSVADTAGLQELFSGSAARTTFALNVNAKNISSATVAATLQKLEPVIRSGMGSYLASSAPTLTIGASKLTITQPTRLNHIDPLNIYATSMQHIQPALHLVQGRWASEQMDNGVIEFMLSATTARALGLTPGATLTLQSNFVTAHSALPVDPRGELTLRLAGIFADLTFTDNPELHGTNFQPIDDYFGRHYTFLLPSTAFLQGSDQIAARERSDFVTVGNVDSIFHLTWFYHLRTAQLQFEHIDDLTSHLANVQYKVTTLPTGESQTFPYMNDATFSNLSSTNTDILGLLGQYTSRIAILNLPLSLLAWQTIALLLFFACLLVSQWIERQMTMSAHLSSRGASPAQVRGSLIAQSMGLCLLALVLGPLLGSLAIYTFALRILPMNEQTVLNEVFSSPGHTLALVAPYLGTTFLVAMLALGLLCWRASEVNTLELRRETTRTSKQPFWLRYYLDLLAALLAFSSFGVALYLAQVARVLDIKTQELVIAPLTLVTPLFLLLGALLLFLRAFPFLLRGAARLSRPTRGTTPMLALVQMARSPRQATRLIMLLTLATTFASFTLIFSASQNQRALDIAAYESGADFAGNLSGELIAQTQKDLAARYNQSPQLLGIQTQQAIALRYGKLPGVLAASVGYTGSGSSTGLDGSQVSLELQAVDTSSFANTATWGAQDSSLPLSALMNVLRQLDSPASTGLIVPAIVDETTLNNLHLSQGGIFDVSSDSGVLAQDSIPFQVVAVVQHIPGANGSVGTINTSSASGMLVDYQTYNAIYLNHQKMANLPPAFIQSLTPNYAWLRSGDTQAALTMVRSVLSSSSLTLDNLYDRRAISADLQSDPLIFSILLLLSIGGITALVLAFLGNLVTAWLNVRLRLNTFVVLRALGASRWQVVSILLWEQGIVYLTALVFSLLLGGVLAWLVVPALVFTGLPAHGVLSEVSAAQFYLLQRELPPQIVIPMALQLAWPALVCACALALVLMARVILRASYGQELRLNED